MPPVIKNLIIINVAIWLVEISGAGSWLLEHFALYDIRSPLFKVYQPFTYMFLHDPSPSDPWHVIFNMFAVWMFGSTLENYWGSKRFLTFYLICGVGAGCIDLVVIYFQNLHFDAAIQAFRESPTPQTLQDIVDKYNLDYRPGSFFDPDSMLYSLRRAFFSSPTMGASGAVFGVLVAFGYLFPNSEMFIIPIPFPVKAKYIVGGYVLLELWQGVRSAPGDDVAHFAHLGGALVGLILVFIWNKTNRRDFY